MESSLSIQTNHLPPEVFTVFDILLKHGEARLVGGSVRDSIRNLLDQPCSIQEFDVATTIAPNDTIAILRSSAIKVVLTGVLHGTVAAVVGKEVIEITTLRDDISCDGRHALVRFHQNWEADAARRDFTINSMSMDIDGKVYDYFDGISHLKHSLVKYVGDPIARIREDYLRILRYFRFCAKIGINNICHNSLNSSIELADHLKKIAVERIKVEFFKLLSEPFANLVIAIMQEHGILSRIGLVFDLQPQRIRELRFSSFHEINPAILNLSVLLKLARFSTEEILAFAKNFRLSRVERKEILSICFPEFEFPTAELLERWESCVFLMGKKAYLAQIAVLFTTRQLDLPMELLEKVASFSPVQMPVAATDLIAFGVKAELIKVVLNKTRKFWAKNNFKLGKEELFEFVVGLKII